MGWDVFVSYDTVDGPVVTRIADALEAAGLRVFLDRRAIRTFISDEAFAALHESRILLAYYSASYPTRPACQVEFGRAYLAAQAAGDPRTRVLAINPENSSAHIEPVQLRDVLLPGRPVTEAALTRLVGSVRAAVDAAGGVLGDFPAPRPRWLTANPHYPPSPFLGRWSELWRLHSALHPDAAPLTNHATAPVVVLHGTIRSGKTALAAEYARRFGAAFPEGIAWLDADSPAPEPVAGSLWIVDDVSGPPDEVRRAIPDRPTVPCLLLTRDPRLTELGNPLRLDDLREDEHPVPEELREAAEGDLKLLADLASRAGILGGPRALRELSERESGLLTPTVERLTPVLSGLGADGLDALRAFAAASPVAISLGLLADVLAALHLSDRETEFARAQRQASALLSAGLLTGPPKGDEFALPQAFAYAVRMRELAPERADQVRRHTLRALATRIRAERAGLPVAVGRHRVDEEERYGAHRVLNELRTRVSLRDLSEDRGSLQKAIASLYAMMLRLREIQGDLHPSALRESTEHRPGLGSVLDRLLNDLLPGFLTRWHPRLDEHFELRPPGVGSRTHELAWPRVDEAWAAIAALQPKLREAAAELAEISGNPLGLREF